MECERTFWIQQDLTNLDNWELTLVQISGSFNCRSAPDNMFKEVIKWTSLVFLSNTALFLNLDLHHKINLLGIKCKNVSFDVGLKNILGILHA
jgi:hypothetical protein